MNTTQEKALSTANTQGDLNLIIAEKIISQFFSLCTPFYQKGGV